MILRTEKNNQNYKVVLQSNNIPKKTLQTKIFNGDMAKIFTRTHSEVVKLHKTYSCSSLNCKNQYDLHLLKIIYEDAAIH